MRPSVRACVRHIKNEFPKHSKESMGVLGQGAQDGGPDRLVAGFEVIQ